MKRHALFTAFITLVTLNFQIMMHAGINLKSWFCMIYYISEFQINLISNYWFWGLFISWIRRKYYKSINPALLIRKCIMYSYLLRTAYGKRNAKSSQKPSRNQSFSPFCISFIIFGRKLKLNQEVWGRYPFHDLLTESNEMAFF